MQPTIKGLRPFSSTARPYGVHRRSPVLRIRGAPQSSNTSGSDCSTSGSDNLWFRSLATLDVKKAQPIAAAALLVLGMAATCGDASAADIGEVHAQPLAELAEQDFWGNIARYGRYFVTVMLGTGYVMLRPLQSMMKRPVTALLAIAAIVGLFIGTRIALEFMLGINEYDYNPDNFRIATQY